MHQKHKILELRAKGYNYQQIVDELGCSKGTIAYHCNPITKQKTKNRRSRARKTQHPLQKKLETFLYRKRRKPKKVSELSNNKRISRKINSFCYKRGVKPMSTFNIQDIINKVGENPKCYITGRLIDIYNPSTYQLDHIQPVSRGGSNELDNLGIVTPTANQVKSDMTLEELIEFCKDVLTYNGHKVEKT